MKNALREAKSNSERETSRKLKIVMKWLISKMETKQLEETHQQQEQGQQLAQQTILNSHLLNSLHQNLLFLKMANKMLPSIKIPKLWINHSANTSKMLYVTIKVFPRIKLLARLKSIICHQGLLSLRKFLSNKIYNNKTVITLKGNNCKNSMCIRNQTLTKISSKIKSQMMISNSCKILKWLKVHQKWKKSKIKR
jgi:hypothetical protein